MVCEFCGGGVDKAGLRHYNLALLDENANTVNSLKWGGDNRLRSAGATGD